MVDDLISRQSAINAIENTECELLPEEWDELTDAIMNVPSIQPNLYEMINEAHNEGFDVGYWAGRRDYEQKWIPVSEHLPEDLEEVNITWVNHAPEQYYADIKDVPFVAIGVYYKGRWYWWSAVCVDYLREYGKSPMDAIDDSIEVVAWMPRPEPYKEERR